LLYDFKEMLVFVVIFNNLLECLQNLKVCNYRCSSTYAAANKSTRKVAEDMLNSTCR